MSKHKNYTKMYDRDEPAVVEEPTSIVDPDPVPVHVDEPKFVTGVVTGCAKLNVREHPNIEAEVICVLSAASEVQIDADNHYDDWYHVITVDGREGYCMEQYIKIA